MGQLNSRFKVSKTRSPNSSDNIVVSQRKYPLPVEAHMLRQIKEQYQPSGKAEDEDELETVASLGDVYRQRYLDDYGVLPDSIPAPLHDFAIKSLLETFPEKESKSVIEMEPNNVEENESAIKIIEFPVLVVQKILEFLPPSCILALRATCSQTKQWIDMNHYILRDFQIHIKNEMCNYSNCSPNSSPWSNFAIPYVRLHSTLVQDTINDNCDNIWRLEIFAPRCINSVSTSYPPNHPYRLFQIINKCPRLQYLKVCRIDSLTELGEFEYLFIHVLSIDRIQWMCHSDFYLFENLIMKCPNLEYLKIPEFEIKGSLAFVYYDAQSSPEREHLIRPIIRYLDTYRQPDVACPHKNKLYIDVVEFEDFKLCSSDVFYELSRKCKECNAVLMNVYFVPRDAVFRNQQNIVESFASMFGFIKIDFCAELWKNLEVMECWIEDYPEDLELTMRQLSFLKTISKIDTLRSLTVRLSVEEPYVCSAALEACVGQNYNGIQKLILRRHHINPDNHVRIPEGFGNSFSNLKYLYFQELDSSNSDFRNLWPNLQNLSELFVYKCPYFTQDAFLLPNEAGCCTKTNGEGDGVQEHPILKLKKLQILVIFLYDGLCGFNDDFISKALKFMPLKGFALRGTTGVEFTELAMLSLLDTPFHETIEDFEAPSSCFRANLSENYWNFYCALPKKELRRNRIWLSCSVLLNSLSSRKHPYDSKRKCLEI